MPVRSRMIFERCLHTIHDMTTNASTTFPPTPESSADHAMTKAHTGKLIPNPMLDARKELSPEEEEEKLWAQVTGEVKSIVAEAEYAVADSKRYIAMYRKKTGALPKSSKPLPIGSDAEFEGLPPGMARDFRAVIASNKPQRLRPLTRSSRGGSRRKSKAKGKGRGKGRKERGSKRKNSSTRPVSGDQIQMQSLL